MNKRTRGDILFDCVNYFLMALVIVIMLLPFVLVINGSLVPESEFLTKKGVVLIPSQISLDAYSFLFRAGQLPKAFVISVLRTALGVPFSILLSLILAYTLTKKQMPGQKALTVFLIIMMYFDGGMIPFLLMVRDIGLYNTFWMYILPFGINVFYVIILRNFIQTIPESLFESARIDGASEIRILFKIVAPLALPGIATVALFYAVMHWNDWFTGFAYMQGGSMIPMQTFLKRMISSSDSDLMNMSNIVNMRPPLLQSVKMAAIVLTTIPIVIVYPFIQKYFVKGLLIGSVKE